MRLDKYLKICRIIKRRSVSKDIISFGDVYINGRVAKPASSVNIGDELTLHLGEKKITIKVNSIEEKVKKEEAINLYSVIKEEKYEETKE